MENKVVNFNCTNCTALGATCYNFANNLISLYFDYWLSKVTIHNDPKNYLQDIFDIANFKKMKKGIISIILDYFEDDILLGDIIEIKTDYNNRPIAARVIISLNNFQTKEIYVIDWKLANESKKELLDAYLISWGWKTLTTYKCIFFINNVSWRSSLSYLNKIIWNVHELDEINDRNHCVINTLFLAKADKKPTAEQASNVSVTFSTDGFGAWVVDWNKENIIGSAVISKEIVQSNLSKWEGIQKELVHWEDKFLEYAGISKEKLSNQRENLFETVSRFSRVNSIEKQYYKYILKFLQEYEEYFKIKLEYEFDSIVENTLKEAVNNLRNLPKTAENIKTENIEENKDKENEN